MTWRKKSDIEQDALGRVTFKVTRKREWREENGIERDRFLEWKKYCAKM